MDIPELEKILLADIKTFVTEFISKYVKTVDDVTKEKQMYFPLDILKSFTDSKSEYTLMGVIITCHIWY